MFHFLTVSSRGYQAQRRLSGKEQASTERRQICIRYPLPGQEQQQKVREIIGNLASKEGNALMIGVGAVSNGFNSRKCINEPRTTLDYQTLIIIIMQ